MRNCSKHDSDDNYGGCTSSGVYVKFIFLYFVSDCLFVPKIYFAELACIFFTSMKMSYWVFDLIYSYRFIVLSLNNSNEIILKS